MTEERVRRKLSAILSADGLNTVNTLMNLGFDLTG